VPRNIKKSVSDTVPLPTTLTITITQAKTQEDFLKQAQREARQAARRLWRGQHPVNPSKGGRPSLESAVWAACNAIWEKWGGTFPRQRSSAKALVDAIAKDISGYRTDLRTIEAHVRTWIDCTRTMMEVPGSWLRTAQGKDLVRSQYMQAIIGELIREHGLTFTGMSTCSNTTPKSTNEEPRLNP
jgi:hypothetical protein